MIIRILNKKDIKACSKIVGENYSKKYRNNSFKEISEMFGKALIKPKYVVAEEDKKIIGFGGYIQSFMDYHVYQIFWINVSPSFQRKNIGTKIVKKIIQEIKLLNKIDKKPLLIQLTTTKPKFYKKRFGFKIVEEFKDKHYLMTLGV